MNTIIEYFEALERLKKGNTQVVPPGSKITNDSVALEAGRRKGSIKRSREVFHTLIHDIKQAALEQEKPKRSLEEKLTKAKEEASKYRELYEEALGRELMLVNQVYQLEAELNSRKSEFAEQ